MKTVATARTLNLTNLLFQFSMPTLSSYFSSQKLAFLRAAQWFQRKWSGPQRSVFHLSSLELSLNLLRSPRGKIASHLYQIVGDYPEPDPSLHALEPAIQTAAQPVSSLECADAAF